MKLRVPNPLGMGGGLLGGGPPNKDFLVKATIANNQNKEIIKRMFDSTVKVPFVDDGGKPTFGSHYMEVSDGMAYPRIINKNGKLMKVSSQDAYKHAIETGEFLKFDNDDDAVYFTENYKRFTPLGNRQF